MTAPVDASPYRSIFLSRDWAHQKYFGWRVVEERPGLRVLTKRHAVFTRHLMLLTREGGAAADSYIARSARLGGLSDIVVHDFDRCLASRACIAGREFQEAAQDQRLLNVATFVVALRQDEGAILHEMTADYRRKIRKAEAAGITVEGHEQPPREFRSAFFSALQSLAGERGLAPVSQDVIEAMYAAGDAMLFVTRKGGSPTNYLHIYRTDNIGFFMYGVNLSRENDGAGQFLHWSVMRRLKADGLSWYDLGGVASRDAADGIYTFKARFGGSYVDLGTEMRWSSPCVEAAAQVSTGLRQLMVKR